jgi:ATP-binding cassette subfamily C exporter for protease/lipase
VRNINFQLEPGECLAVIGPSACGKTTLARLLVGVWQPQMGKVRLDGADLASWSKEELGPHLGYLPQGVELFDGTLADNIARFGEVDADKLALASRLSGLDPLVQDLPDGFKTFIGPEGTMLSGGQRQRVGLARAIYGTPSLVVLDEPNSSLDRSGEQDLMRMIDELKKMGSTVVIITHRPHILSEVEKILLMREGQVQAYGPSKDVLAALQKAREDQEKARAQQAASIQEGGAA